MRLICPQCNALYDVSAEMIPPEGREVECSACGHVWHQCADAGGIAGRQQPPARAVAPELGDMAGDEQCLQLFRYSAWRGLQLSGRWAGQEDGVGVFRSAYPHRQHAGRALLHQPAILWLRQP